MCNKEYNPYFFCEAMDLQKVATDFIEKGSVCTPSTIGKVTPPVPQTKQFRPDVAPMGRLFLTQIVVTRQQRGIIILENVKPKKKQIKRRNAWNVGIVPVFVLCAIF